MVGLKHDKIIHVPLEEVAGKLKCVDPQSAIIEEARNIGISFGEMKDLGLSKTQEVAEEPVNPEKEKKVKKEKK